MTRVVRGRRRPAAIVVLVSVVIAIGLASSETASPALVAVESAAGAPGMPRRVYYGDAADTFGDLYLPTGGTGPYPVVVMIHGGSWSQSRTLAGFAPMARSLADSGVAVWNIEYRRMKGDGGWPVTLTDAGDAVAALATVVQHTCGDCLDLSRVHLAGYSAGGQLAAWVAGWHNRMTGPAAHSAVRIRSVTLMAAVLDLRYAATNGRDGFVRTLLGGRPAEVPDRYDFASPIAHLPVDTHISAVHGDADRVVELEQSRRYIAAATRAGLDTDLRILPGVGHGEFAELNSAAWATTRTTILDNVARLR
ncbi:S9 family peptidase [Nocardia sp. BMG51109]|uniref:alpha/beta hydrolase family protein n=1 Tax=Nocardia sp. BMG51109 TaxID=1056816 RepID=UPI000683EF38|nr:prolyl oligopeptidase family serine peptidase [Nocardia sp. BMG51109]